MPKGLKKEYHIFDTGHWFTERRDADLCYLRRILDKNQLLLDGSSSKIAKQLTLMSFRQDYKLYFDYFESLALKNPTKTIFSDISPSYCSLSVETLKFIQTEFGKRGFRLKVIFLMRDPINRLKSSILHMISSKTFKDFSSGCVDLDIAVVKNYNHPIVRQRSDYGLTIKNSDNALKSDDILYQFYEEMFDEKFALKFGEFVGDSSYRPIFSKRRNDSKDKYQAMENITLTDSTYEKVRISLSSVYRFVEYRFGRYPDEWKQSLLRL